MYRELAGEIPTKAGPSGRIDLEDSLAIVRDLQGRANYNPNVEKVVNEARKSIAYDARRAIEDAIEEQAARSGSAETQQIASQFAPSKRALRLALEAGEAASRTAKRGPSFKEALMDVASLGAGSIARSRGPSTLARAYYGAGSMAETLGRPAAWVGQRLPSPQGGIGAIAGDIAAPGPVPTLPPLPAIALDQPSDELDAMIAEARRQTGARAEATRENRRRGN
jgi:hypothetical protein